MLVSAGSPVLAAIFHHDCKESRNLVVEVEDISADVFQQYLYTGSAKKMENFASDLLVAADKYQIEPLKKKCASFLTEELTVDNATGILVLVHLHDCPELLQSALDCVVENPMDSVALLDWKNLVKNYPELCVQVTQIMLAKSLKVQL